MRRRPWTGSTLPTIGEVCRRLDAMEGSNQQRFADLQMTISSRLVSLELYRAEQREITQRLADMVRDRSGRVAFTRTLTVGVITAIVASFGSMITVLVTSGHP